MPIRLKQRAEVRDDFVELYRQAAEEKLRKSLQNLGGMNDQMRTATLKRSPAMYGRLGAIVKNLSGVGMGMDNEVTRLHALGYETYGVFRDRTNGPYFVGLTRPITMKVVGTIRHSRRSYGTTTHDYAYDAGKYWVYVPYSLIENKGVNGIHLLPERAPTVEKRHPHHVAYARGKDKEHPTHWDTSWCWSEFTAPVGVAAKEFDLPQLFALLLQFCDTFNASSPLATPENYPEMLKFMKKVQA